MSAFKRLAKTLKQHNKTCAVVEQCCGGTINSSLLAQPGTSKVYLGGSIIYNTRKGLPLLMNNETLHNSLCKDKPNPKTKEEYIQSKIDWTAKTSVAFCNALGTDYVIAEGGAAGPTFRFGGMESGFAVLSVAGKEDAGGAVANIKDDSKVIEQKVIHSPHANREENMRLFADAAADLLSDIIDKESKIGQTESSSTQIHDETKTMVENNDENNTKSDELNILLDRATKLRSDPQALKEMEPQAKYVIVNKNDMLVRSADELALLSHEEVAHLKSHHSNQMTFLGILTDEESKTPIFGIDIRDEDKSNSSDETSTIDGCYFVNTRTGAPLLPKIENELALHFMAYANWQRNNSYCTICGGTLELINAGTTHKCNSCNALSWPRQDPSMIASITSRCGERILLARSKRHPPKLHTVLAGFVEAGETFEAAVSREVWEETGIRIDEDSIAYIGSQPWPFPQSSMIAFTATADDTQPLNIDEDELVDAQWFGRNDVLAATKVDGPVMQHDVAKAAIEINPNLPLLIPPKRVIARTLIDTWLERRK